MPRRHLIRRVYRKVTRPLRQVLGGTVQPGTADDIAGPVLLVMAHPDDEAFCSGLLCALREREISTSILCLTRGEGGERGSLDPEADLGAVREQELRASATALGITRVDFLGFADPASDPQFQSFPKLRASGLVEKIQRHVEGHGIATVLSHGSSGEYWHPAHFYLHRAVARLARRCPALSVWTINAWNPRHPLPNILNKDDRTDLMVDATEFHPRRLDSLACHESQRGVFERFSGGDRDHFIRSSAVESYHRLQ